MPPQVGQVINNKYRLLRHIGDGGMGSVYEARHEALGTTVALKFLHLEFSRREGLVQRFLQEARASARIQSPHVVRVSDVDQTTEGDVFIVLEYLEGKTLQALYEELYRAGRRLSYAEALDFAEQMLEGLQAAHEAGIVHRDLKPDNVMLTVDAKGATLLKLLDFGIAKLKVVGGAPGPGPGLTRPGVMMGTPEYMAPEQASSADAVDLRADIFSLGVIIFEMLGGRRPVGGDDPGALAAAHRSGRISQLADLLPGIAPELAAAVHRAMAADPAGRFVSAAEMLAAIEPFVAAVRPPSPSRVRAGGTVGVSHVPLAVQPAPPAPPPPTTSRPPAPGGVAKTWPPEEGPPPVMRGGGTIVDAPGSAQGGLHADRTYRMDQPYQPQSVPIVGGAVRAPAEPLSRRGPLPGPRRARRRRGGSSVLWAVVAAAGVAGLVTGGVYLASRSSSNAKDDEPSPPTSPTSAVVPAATAPEPPPPGDPPPSVPTSPSPGPAPKPGRARAKPAPSGSPSADPGVPPPAIVLPTAFPFPNPFQPAPSAPGSGSPKQPDPPPLIPLP